MGRKLGRLALRPLHLLAAPNAVALVDVGPVLLALAAVDRLALVVPGVHGVVAAAALVGVHAGTPCQLVLAGPALEAVLARATPEGVVARVPEELVVALA